MTNRIMTKRIKEYWCINATTYAALNKGVNAAIATGYTLHGNVQMNTSVVDKSTRLALVQVVVKYKRSWLFRLFGGE